MHVQAYLYDGYWEDIGTIEAFYEANLALTDSPKPDFRCPACYCGPVYPSPAPALYVHNSWTGGRPSAAGLHAAGNACTWPV